MTRCGSCGKDIPAGAKFCGICGHPMEPSAPLPPEGSARTPAQPGGAQAHDPVPGVTGQTNFFKVAAEVDRDSQILRTLKGVIMLVAVVLALVGLLTFILTQQDRPKGAEHSMTPPTAAQPSGERGNP